MGHRRPHAAIFGSALAFVAGLWLLPFGAMSGAGLAYAQSRPARIVVFHSNSNQVPASVATGKSATKRLMARAQTEAEVYTEFLDFERFAVGGHAERMARHLSEKYEDRKPAVILAIGPTALRFLVQNRKGLGFDAPVVFSLTSRARLATISPDPDVTGIISDFDLTKTLALARRLQPEARSIVVVSGASEFDRQWVRIARSQLSLYDQQFEVRFLEGLAHGDLMQALKSLSRDTIVVMLTVNRHGDGGVVVPAEAVKEIARTSGAPVYSPYQTHLGSGVIGGHSDSFEGIGDEVADLALSILAGTTPSAIPPRPTSSDKVRVDWRQLRRWGISESQLPAAAEVHFREPSLWDRYRWQVITVILVVLAQAAALAWMLVERQRRRAAQVALRQRLLEVIHLNRSAMAGALSASVAHELNQPLAAIQSYADAAEMYLKANPPNIERIEKILVSIREDNKRAADVISHFRGLLRKTDAFEPQELDINDVIRSTLRIIDPEALKRGVSLSTSQVEASLPVLADQVHLEQVLLNLAMNGMDAMQHQGSGKMLIQTALVDELAGRGVCR